jgi:ribose transport system substrate-binding protein
MLAGVIVAAQRAGIDPKSLVLVGHNCSIEGVTALENGTQYATVLQSPIEDGIYAAQAVANLLDGKKVENIKFLSHPMIKQAQVKDCYPAVGK